MLDEKYFNPVCSQSGEVFIRQTTHYLAGKSTILFEELAYGKGLDAKLRFISIDNMP
jgi:hypothetical protein